MGPLIHDFIVESFQSDEELQRVAELIAQNLTDKTYDITYFVEELGFALTSPTTDERVKGTNLLSHVLQKLPRDFLSDKQLEFLTTFYADRLNDHHNVMPAVIEGMDALVRMKFLPPTSAPKLLNAFFQHSTCQSQLRNDRAKLFKILKYLSEEHAEELKTMSGDFIYGVINSVDGERDPRNLDYIFDFMPRFIADFPLLHLSEEMFEIFACYFPIDFNPSKTDPDYITRDKLAEKLTNCLVASPEFVEWTVALALEKAESALVVAKLDSYELLQQSALKFPPKILEPHFEQIWTALKTEILGGGDNPEVKRAALKALRLILKQAVDIPDVSRNYQTIVLSTILPRLNNVKQHSFELSTSMAMACVDADPKFACDKILNTFLLKLNAHENASTDASATGTAVPPTPSLDDDERTKIYYVVAGIFQLAYGGKAINDISIEVCMQLHTDIIAALRRALGDIDESKQQQPPSQNLELIGAALMALANSVVKINEPNRALVYKVLVQLITHESIDLDLTNLMQHLALFKPIELQSNCIDVCIRNFPIYTQFVKRKVYKNLLPLVPIIAFTQRVLDLLWMHIFKAETTSEVRLIALESLNTLLRDEKINSADLQRNYSLIEKLVNLAQEQKLDLSALEQIAAVISRIVKSLPIAEQYMIATEYLPKLDMQLAADLYIAKGLLGFLHDDISLDDHFERLANDLTKLSLESDNEQLRQEAHYLLCSLVNRIDYSNTQNRVVITKLIAKLKVEIVKEDPKAVEALSWLAKGLIVCGFDEVGEVVESLADLLEHPCLATAASLAFSIISAEYPELHLTVIKYLFKQKFFHMILSKFGEKLEKYCEHHLVAFIYVLKTTPHVVLKMNIEKIGPILFMSLECRKKHTLCIALEICHNFIVKQDEYFRSHLNHVISSCLTLSKFQQSMQVRIQALNLLFEITKYPTFVLLPQKMDLVLEIATALDDPKRLVRNAAVRARNAWFLVGAPSTEDN